MSLIESIIKANTYGDNEKAFFILDIEDLFVKHNQWLQCLPRVQPFYAVKANNLQLIIQILANLGIGFDCSSQREVESVMGCGVDTSRIIFANPCKSRAQLRYVKSIGLKLMTFDNEEELIKVSVLYPEAQLVLRIKTDNTYSTSKLSLKFGADIHETEHLLSRAKCLGLNVIGIAFHVGSGCQKSDPYLEAIHKAKNAFNIGINLGFNMTLLDIGGGFLGSAELAKLPFCTVTADINEALDRHFPADSGVTIIAEPGRFYTISAFHLCAQITSKRVVVTDDRTQRLIMYYINDGLYGSFSSVTTGHRSVQPIPVLKDTDRLDSRTQCLSVIWGPTCDSYDCVRSEHLMAEMMVGEWLWFKDMGSYSICAATTFNGMPAPKIIVLVNHSAQLLLNNMTDRSHIDKLIAIYQNCDHVLQLI